MGVTIDDRALKGSLRRLRRYVGNTTPVYRKAALHMRNYVRQTITLQGRKSPYKQLSWWTKQKTGRRKALITLRPRIKAAWGRQIGAVFFDPVSAAWHIDQHHTGYISKEVTGKRMAIPRKGGGLVALLMNRKQSVIPRREIWPGKGEAAKEIQPIVQAWLTRGARKTWR